VNWNPDDIPRPRTATDLLTCYEANLREARQKLENMAGPYRALRAEGMIYQDEQTGSWMSKGKDAARVYGEVIRWRSDIEHWSRLMGQTRTAALSQARDPRLPREPGEDDDGPYDEASV
jgi:hypothetical protein